MIFHFQMVGCQSLKYTNCQLSVSNSVSNSNNCPFVVEHPLDNQEVQEYVATIPLWLRLYGQHQTLDVLLRLYWHLTVLPVLVEVLRHFNTLLFEGYRLNDCHLYDRHLLK